MNWKQLLALGVTIAERIGSAGSFSILDWVELALGVWKDNVGPLTPNSADEKIASELLASVQGYRAVHGTEVTKVQLDSLRTQKLW